MQYDMGASSYPPEGNRRECVSTLLNSPRDVQVEKERNFKPIITHFQITAVSSPA